MDLKFSRKCNASEIAAAFVVCITACTVIATVAFLLHRWHHGLPPFPQPIPPDPDHDPNALITRDEDRDNRLPDVQEDELARTDVVPAVADPWVDPENYFRFIPSERIAELTGILATFLFRNDRYFDLS